jgi:DNA modification methylase
MIEINKIYNMDCLEGMKNMFDNSVDYTLTDIPYDVVNRESNGLRNLDKGKADVLTFDLEEFLEEVYRVSKNSITIFCSKEQFSFIFGWFANKKGTVRPIIWEKSNPSPMNGQYVYLSGVEFAVWFKKSGAKTFNAHCKNTVLKHPNGSRKIHPTEKNHKLLEELILDNSNEGDIVFDPCFGSGSTLLVAKKLKRNYLGIELDKQNYDVAQQRINKI